MRYFILLLLSAISFSAISQEKSKLMKEGMDYFYQKEYDKALKAFRKEFNKSPTVEVKFWMGYCYAYMKEVTRAKPLFWEIANSSYQGPEVAMSMVNLGNCYAELHQADSALYYYDKAIAGFPEFESAYFNKGQFLYASGRFEEAKQNFDKAIELKPDDWWYYQKRLEVCFASSNYECALRDLIKVKELHPETENEMNLAYCYTMLQRYQKADSVFQKIYNDRDPVFLNNYGFNKYKMGHPDEGKALIMKSIAINPENSFAYRNLAVISLDLNDAAAACKYLLKAKELGFEKNYGNEVNEMLNKFCK